MGALKKHKTQRYLKFLINTKQTTKKKEREEPDRCGQQVVEEGGMFSAKLRS